MKSLVAAAISALAIGLIGVSCSSGSSDTSVSPSAAATVNGVPISKSDFEADMKDYAANSAFVATGQAGTDAEAGTVGADFVRSTLQSDILFEVVRQEAARRELTIPPTDDADVRAQTIARFDQSGSPDILNAFPKRFQDRALAQTAAFVALQDALGGGPVDAAQVKAAYDADPRSFGEICVRQIQLTTQDDANRVYAELQQGADFAQTVAKESEDTSSQATGGKLTNPDGSCPRASQLDADFAKAALAATPGQITPPLQTSLGWHILLVDSVTPLPFEQVQTDAAVAAEQAVAAKAAPALSQILASGAGTGIEINPGYGTWDPTNHQILPPGFKAQPRATTTVGGG